VLILAAGLSATHWKTAVAQCAQGAALAGLDRYSEAEPLLTQGLAILGKDGGAPPQYRQLAVKYLDQMHIEERSARRQGAPVAPRVAKTRAIETVLHSDADGHNVAIAGTTRP
jgi:hypothetical protein